eukprot:TRINITY_DN91186_c0_g1_i1.p1 TRINITY_DN91186_c0_g1~~TRINITY_DN91186_c0_g1_i1.p1  ORF type:complete len:455 (-),score=94.36 TRINITY_DN91186_c0_g1_i1:116-1480(-)
MDLGFAAKTEGDWDDDEEQHKLVPVPADPIEIDDDDEVTEVPVVPKALPALANGSSNSPPPSKIHHNPLTRYFVIKSNSHRNLVLSVENNVWATQRHNEEKFNEAFRTAPHVIFIFSVNSSGCYQGYAKMLGAMGASKKTHVFKGFGRAFDLKWLRLNDLDFGEVSDIQNSLNENKSVKISRDGQELDRFAGKRLCELVDERVWSGDPTGYVDDSAEVETGSPDQASPRLGLPGLHQQPPLQAHLPSLGGVLPPSLMQAHAAEAAAAAAAFHQHHHPGFPGPCPGYGLPPPQHYGLPPPAAAAAACQFHGAVGGSSASPWAGHHPPPWTYQRPQEEPVRPQPQEDSYSYSCSESSHAPARDRKKRRRREGKDKKKDKKKDKGSHTTRDRRRRGERKRRREAADAAAPPRLEAPPSDWRGSGPGHVAPATGAEHQGQQSSFLGPPTDWQGAAPRQ